MGDCAARPGDGAVCTCERSLLTISPTNPVAGDTVTAHGSPGECPNNTPPTYTFSFTLAGASTPVSSGTYPGGGAGPQYSAVLAQAGSYTAAMTMTCADPSGNQSYTSAPFTVGAGLGGGITVSPTPTIVNQPVTLSAAATGGNPGYTFAWNLSGTGATFTDAATRVATTTFTTTGVHTVKVQIKDTAAGGNPQHTTVVTQTINVVAPTTNAPAPPPPPPCTTRLAFQLSEFTTTGCFTQSSSNPAVYTTTSQVKFNGATLADYGQTFTVTEPTTTDPGGHFTAPNSTVQIGAVTVFSGNIDWSLPAGGSGDQEPAESFTVATGYSFLGLTIAGTVSLTLGQDASGSYYSLYGLNLQLPASFTAGPDPSFGSVTGAVAVKVDDSGVHYGGLELQAQNVWVGKLQVESVCFSYIPPNGSSADQCAAPTLGGGNAPFVQCASDSGTSRWDASAVVDLPSGLQLGAFGGLADGSISTLGGSIGNLGTRVPIADGVYLDHVAFGLCLSPPPLVIRANIGANFLGSSNLVSLSGGFTYTDATESTPWSLMLDGSLAVGDIPIGSGTLSVDGNGIIDFGLQAGFSVLDNAVSINGQVNGWIDAPEKAFAVGGDVQGCLGTACATASGELSSTGVAGCITIGTSLPTYDLIIPLDGGSPHLDTSVYPITAGFGYVWRASTVDLLGGSCDFSSYEPANAFLARAAGANTRLKLKVAANTQAVALRIHGTHGAPRVILRGPDGTIISSPVKGTGKLSKGHYVIVENRTNGTTDVMLLRPAAGTWRVSRAPGSGSSLTTIDRANLEVPPTFGAVVKAKRELRTVQVAYAVPVGASVRLVEQAKGIKQTIARNLLGHRCPGLPALRPGTNEKILCTNVTFRPAPGPGGKRKVQAIVTLHRIPLLQKNIASFTAPRQALPSRIGVLLAKRSGGNLIVAFSTSTTASHYSVSAELSDGRKLAFYLSDTCHAVRIVNVPTDVGAVVKVAGVRYDLAMGRSRTISIQANSQSAKGRGRKLKVGRVCT